MDHKLLVVFMAATSAFAAGTYRNLIATPDGNGVAFVVKTGLVESSGFLVRKAPDGRFSSNKLPAEFVDISASGETVASSFLGFKQCGFAGSSCWLASACRSSFWITAGDKTATGLGAANIRLSRSGESAWIEETTICASFAGQPRPALRRGLYNTRTLELIYASNSTFSPASKLRAARLVTDAGAMLALSDQYLFWMTATGVQVVQFPKQTPTSEAVTDSRGCNIAFRHATTGQVGWIGCSPFEQSGELGFIGQDLLLSDDGRHLVFRDSGGGLSAYDRGLRMVRGLLPKAPESVAIGGHALFVSSAGTGITRYDLDNGTRSEWLAAVPEIRGPLAGNRDDGCLGVCYGPVESSSYVPVSGVGLLEGDFSSVNGWSFSLRSSGGETEVPGKIESEGRAWFQIPRSASPGFYIAAMRRPDHPITLEFRITADHFPSCLATVHQDFSSAVTPENPARIGEIVHVFLTGVRGFEEVADGVANPADRLVPLASPLIARDPGAAEVIFSGLAPGLIGIQQADVRIKARFPNAGVALFAGPPFCSAPPVE